MHPPQFAGFLSYHQRLDGGFCRQLQEDLERFGKPLWRPRLVRLFRDESNLEAGGDLGGAIRKALDQSEHLIFVARPESAKRPWILAELDHFLADELEREGTPGDAGQLPGEEAARARRKAKLQRLICVITAGRHPWEGPLAEGDPEGAIPDGLGQRFREAGCEPLVVDMRRLHGLTPRARRRDSQYTSNLATIAARLLHRDKDSVYGAHLVRQRRILAAMAGTTLALMTLMALAVVMRLKWQESKHAAERHEQEARRNEARNFRSLAEGATDRSSFDQALVYLARAAARDPGEVPLGQLNEYLARAHKEWWRTEVPFEGFEGVGAIEAGGRLLVGGAPGSIRAWDLVTGHEVARLPCELLRIRSVALAENVVFAGGFDGEVWRGDWVTREARMLARPGSHPVDHLIPLPGGRLVVASDEIMSRIFCLQSEGKVVWSNEVTRSVSGGLALAHEPEQGTILALAADGNFKRWDVGTGASRGGSTRTFPVEFQGIPPDYDPISRRATRVEEPEGQESSRSVVVWSLEKGDLVQSFRVPAPPTAVRLARGGGTVWMATSSGELWAGDMVSGALRRVTQQVPLAGRMRGLLEGVGGRSVLVCVDPMIPMPMTMSWGVGQRPAQQCFLERFDTESGRRLDFYAGHEARLTAVAYGADGRWVASGTLQGRVRVWDAATGDARRLLSTEPAAVLALSAGPDPDSLVAGGSDGTTRRWRAADGVEGPPFPRQNGAVCALALAPAGDILATATGMPLGLAMDPATPLAEYVVRLWRWSDGELVRELPLRKRATPHTLQFVDGGRRLMVASSAEVLVWDWESTQLETVFDAAVQLPGEGAERTGEIQSAAMMDATECLVGLASGQIELRNLRYQNVVRSLGGHRSEVTAMAVSKAAGVLVSGCGTGGRLLSGPDPVDDTLRVWEGRDGRLRFALPGFSPGVRSVALSPDGRQAAVGVDDFTLRLLDLSDRLETGREMLSARGEQWVAYHARGMAVVRVGGGLKSSLVYTNLGTRVGTPLAEDGGGEMARAAFSPDGALVASVSTSVAKFTGFLVDTATGASRVVLEEPEWGAGPVRRVDFTSDGGELVVHRENQVVGYSVTHGRRAWSVPLGDGADRLVLAVHGATRRAFVQRAQATYALVDVVSGDRIANLRLRGGGEPISAAFSPDGSRLLTHSSGGRLDVWSAPDLAWLASFAEPCGSADHLVFSPDGTLLGTGSVDGTVQLWDMQRRERIAQFNVSREPGRAVSVLAGMGFTDEGRTLQAFDSEGVLVRWDAERLSHGFRVLAGLTGGERVAFAEQLAAQRWSSNGWATLRPGARARTHALLSDQASPAETPPALPTWARSETVVEEPLPVAVAEALQAQRGFEVAWVARRGAAWAPAADLGTGSGGRSGDDDPSRGARLRWQALAQLGDWLGVATIAGDVVRQDAGDLEAWTVLAEAYFWLNSDLVLSASARAFDLVHEQTSPGTNPLYRRVLSLRGRALVRYQYCAEALPVLQFLCDGNGVGSLDLVEAYLQALIFVGQYERAWERAERAIAESPGVPGLPGIERQRDLARLLKEARSRAPRLPVLCIVGGVDAKASDTPQLGDLLLAIDGVQMEVPNAKIWSDLVFRSTLPSFTHYLATVRRDGSDLQLHLRRGMAQLAVWVLHAPAHPAVMLGAVNAEDMGSLGLRSSDVLLGWGTEKPATVVQFLRGLRGLRPEDPLELAVRRYSWTDQFALELERGSDGLPKTEADGQQVWRHEDLRVPITVAQLRQLPWVPFQMASPYVRQGSLPWAFTGEGSSGQHNGTNPSPDPAARAGPTTAKRKLPFTFSRGRVSFRSGANDADLADLEFAVDATSVRLRNSTNFTVAGLQHLRRLKALRQLDVGQSAVDDVGLGIIGSLTNLTRLDLTRTRITEAGLGALSSLSRLTNLVVTELKALEPGLCALAALPRLNTLRLEKTPISTEAFDCLGRLTALESLSIARAPSVTDALDRLAALPALRELSLRDWPGADTQLRSVSRLHGLESLSLVSCKVGADTLSMLGELHQLTELSLAFCEIDDAALLRLPVLPALTSLDLSSTKITDVGLAALERTQGLTHLDLASTRVVGPGFRALEKLGSLQKIVLREVPLAEAEVAVLAALHSLTELDLEGGKLSDATVAALSGCRKLQDLVLAKNPITGTTLAALTHLPLRHLDLNGTGVGDAAVESLGAIRTLEKLDLQETLVSEAAVAQLEQVLPDLEVRR
ncbi:MAG: PQQ-binding-like beta-propeller repeat protein [Verrucomicrobiales bacterium]|nr:PQQ-binding-like beta-propeller repeat protein [Verrucomicrobiales bacterium]